MHSGNLLIYAIIMEFNGILNLTPRTATQAATFGGNSPPVSDKLGDAALGWVSNVKYLGCYFLSRSCEVDTTRCCKGVRCPPIFSLSNLIAGTNRKAYLLHASFALKDSHCQ